MVNVRLMTAAELFQSPEFLATIKPEQGKRRWARRPKRSWTLFVGAPDARSHRYADVHASDITWDVSACRRAFSVGRDAGPVTRTPDKGIVAGALGPGAGRALVPNGRACTPAIDDAAAVRGAVAARAAPVRGMGRANACEDTSEQKCDKCSHELPPSGLKRENAPVSGQGRGAHRRNPVGRKPGIANANDATHSPTPDAA
jgi:hypothetical protein